MSLPVTCYLGGETDPHLTTASFQAGAESGEAFPRRPPPRQAESPRSLSCPWPDSLSRPLTSLLAISGHAPAKSLRRPSPSGSCPPQPPTPSLGTRVGKICRRQMDLPRPWLRQQVAGVGCGGAASRQRASSARPGGPQHCLAPEGPRAPFCAEGCAMADLLRAGQR